MKSPTTIGLILLAIWLIIIAIVGLSGASFAGLSLLLNILAIAAGFFLLLGVGQGRVRSPGEVGLLLLGIWLIITGLVALLGITLPGLGLVLNILALVAGLLLMLGWRGRSRASWAALVLLGLWLVLSSLFSLLGATFPGSSVVMAILALLAGLLILLAR